MDSLATLHVEASPLLGRVDATLAQCGAPADHAIWPLLRRRGLLPGDAVTNVVAWSAEPLRERAQLMRLHCGRCVRVDGLLRGSSGWEGAAGTTFDARVEATCREHDVLAHNAQTLAGYLEELADWIARGRMRLAHALATVLTSAQSVTLKTQAGPAQVTAAIRAQASADIGAEVLGEVDLFWVGAVELSHSWSSRLEAEVAITVPAVSVAADLRVEL